MGKCFKATYTVTSEASAEAGDYADSGTIESKDITCDPDEYDIEEGLTAVDIAVLELKKDGAIYPCNSTFHPRTWYTTEGNTDYRTGDETRYSYHPYGFTDDELEAIFKAVTAEAKVNGGRP
jgi:hypothetical protein